MSKIVKKGFTGYIKFIRHSWMPVGSDVGWWYTSYNSKTGEGQGIFGMPDDPDYKFITERRYNPQTGRYELMTSACGFGQGCFWSEWQ